MYAEKWKSIYKQLSAALESYLVEHESLAQVITVNGRSVCLRRCG